MVAENRHKDGLVTTSNDIAPLFKYGCSETIGRDMIGLNACLFTQFTIHAESLTNYHCIVRAIGKLPDLGYNPFRHNIFG